MTHEQVQAWLDAYVAAWRSNDAAAIGELFAEDAEYRYHPYDEPLRGRQAIVDSWLAAGRTFSNLFVLAFDGEGRCRGFTEWYMEHPR